LLWSPLASGLLGGHALDGQGGERSSKAGAALDQAGRVRLTEYHRLCAELGETPANVALAWTLAAPAVTAPIIGPRTPQQVAELARAAEIQLEPEILNRLDKLFPGVGGPAPQAYAW
ncbi:MAG: aldo/keto reductase, partial [Propionibacteriaceae bacterium]|nr:aldo/keto reductase [Propionibacteriaceae bacterium]